MKGKRWIAPACCVLALAAAPVARAQVPHPADRWEFALEAGYLAKVRNNSPHEYRIAPVQVAWRSPALWDLWRSPAGARLTVRNRFALLAEAIVRGPENHYFAVSGAPVFEFWAPDRRSAAFFEIGGGVGFIDSRGVAGGQGQDLSFNWYTQGGLRRQLTEDFALTASLYFTHHSNLGMTSPNPGIDVLGLNFGAVWSFR
ncbi:acyloxyacyl hydrolase [Ramlibacter montanisoli]|uniref:Acyloxyacyl hydrolase n=1 Tax=Ramlibacter montanisoli TaxID=2732512 RepID=A0A849KDJ8_9BURK|nr:acyloxyacyl hydrolase [Ramlibacter montanisoli]NNU42811.1 acyloxyacyl hydrolase [Ramlibacter montanisoli]